MQSESAVIERPGLGTFIGVFVPSILMLFGVIIFLRLGWIVGQAGLPTALIIINLSTLIALITMLSMSSIATNIEIGKGGVYYIISRSLGLEIGAAVGLPLYVKQSLTIAFCAVGFAESLHDLMPTWPINTIGVWTIVAFTACAAFSLKGALKVQLAIFAMLFASFFSLFMGSTVPEQASQAVSSSHLGFWAIFAIFFPAITGLESSISLSGDLKNPCRSLPIGTISALLVAYALYAGIPLFLTSYIPIERLASDPLIMQEFARFPSLIIAGIWGATLSSLLGGLMGAPRTLQAIAEDGIVPNLFAKTWGKNKEPVIATMVTFAIALVAVSVGSINLIAPILTMICLICYGILNFAAGFETLMSNPSWRPRFRIHWAVSFLGTILCFIAMLMIDAGQALMALALIGILYLLVSRRKIQASWDDIREGILLFFSRFAIYRLAYTGANTSRCWRPHFLVFAKESDISMSNLVRFSQAISQSKSFLTMASFQSQPERSEEEKKKRERQIVLELQEQKIQALVQINHAEKITAAMHQMISNYGLGPLVPNTIVFGGVAEDSVDFARVIQTSYQKNCNVVILKDRETSTLGDIHLWWDEEEQNNSELMLVLSYMLQKNPTWSKSRICVNAIVTSEVKRKQKADDLESLGVKRRLPLNTKVFVAENSKKELAHFAKEFSYNAGIIFLSLRPPRNNESIEEYASYLHEIVEISKTLPPTALVLSSEFTPLQNILQ